MQYIRKGKGACYFVLLQVILYCSFLILDFTAGSIELSNIIKFSIVGICLCYALFFSGSVWQGQLFCLQLALLFTVISDLCILLLDYYLLGMISFCIVQQLYSRRLDLLNRKNKDIRAEQDGIRGLSIRLGLQLIVTIMTCLILQRFGIRIESLLVVTTFYFISIITNVFRAVKLAALQPKDKGNVLFAIGISLFLLCDINVGFFNASDYIPLSGDLFEHLYSFSTILMWMFYAPSQVLIALSAKIRKNSQKY